MVGRGGESGAGLIPCIGATLAQADGARPGAPEPAQPPRRDGDAFDELLFDRIRRSKRLAQLGIEPCEIAEVLVDRHQLLGGECGSGTVRLSALATCARVKTDS